MCRMSIKIVCRSGWWWSAEGGGLVLAKQVLTLDEFLHCNSTPHSVQCYHAVSCQYAEFVL